MVGSTRFKKAINAYVKNDAAASAIASFLADKDCSQEDLLKVEGFQSSAVALLPILTKDAAERGFLENHFLNSTNGRTIFIVCGVSAAGKDTLASYAKHALYLEGKEFSYSRKYTTRGRRGFEGINQIDSYSEPSGNYQYFSNEDEISALKDAVMSYSLYDHVYALSGNNLSSNHSYDKYQMCIYGKFENIHEIRKQMFLEYQRLPFTVLIKASAEDCEGRIMRRHSMPESEQTNRVKEMKRQSLFIERNKEFVESGFDIVIENSDTTSVADNAGIFTSFLSERMNWANKANAHGKI